MKNPAFNLFTPNSQAHRSVGLLGSVSFLLLATPALAVDTTGVTNTYNGSLADSGLSTGANWTAGSPFTASGAGAYADLVFTGAATGSTFTASGGMNTTMNAESYNVTDGNSYTLQINSSNQANFRAAATSNTGTGEVILPFTNSVSGVAQDMVYLANNSSLTFNATNAGGGTEALFNVRQAGNFNVETGSTLTVNSPITGSTALTINGGGSTISNGINTFSSTITVNGGSLEIAGTHTSVGTFNLNNGSVKISGSRSGGGTNIRNGTFEITGTSGGTGYTLANNVDNPEGTAPELKLGNLNALAATATITGADSVARAGSVNLAVAGSYTMGTYLRGNISFTNSSGSPATLTFTEPSAVSITNNGGRTFANDSANLEILFASTLDIGGNAAANVTLTGTGNITVANGITSTGDGIRSLAKSGAGTLTVNEASSYAGTTTLNGGALVLGHATALPGGIGATGGTSNLVFNSTTAVIGLTAASGDFLRTVGTGPDQVTANPTENPDLIRRMGFAAFGGDRVVDFGAPIALSTASLAGRGLVLGHATADSKVTLVNNINLANASRTVLVNDGSAAVDAELSGVISSPGATIVKTGNGTLALTGENTYASTGGGTEVQAGVLMVNGSSLSDTSKLVIDGGAVHVTGTEIVGSLFFGSEEQAAGIWGSSESSAALAFQDDSRFSGPGVVVVGDSSSSGYESWASINNATGQALDDDHDGDGVSNGVEYFLGGPNGNTTGFNPLPGVVNTAGTLSVTWTKGPGYTGSYGTDFWVETSETFANPWASEIQGVNVTITGDDVTYTFPNPLGGKKFARLKVTGP